MYLLVVSTGRTNRMQWRCQNAEKITHVKGRLLDQTVIQFNCAPFHNGNYYLRKEFAPRGSEFFPLRAVSYDMKNHFYQTTCRWPLEYYYFYYARAYLRNGSYANGMDIIKKTFCGFSMGRNQYWAGRVYDLCVYYMTGTPEGSTESRESNLRPLVYKA